MAVRWLVLPAHLRAAAFMEIEVPRSALDRTLDVETTHHRLSQEMTLCSPDPTADMQNIRGLSVDVIKLAYLFAERPSNLNLGVAHTKFGEVEVHEDTCIGMLLASIPIDPSNPMLTEF